MCKHIHAVSIYNLNNEQKKTHLDEDDDIKKKKWNNIKSRQIW